MIYVQPEGTVFDRLRADGKRARLRTGPIGGRRYLLIERLDVDGAVLSAQAFEAAELDDLALAVKTARCALIGAPDPKAEAQRIQKLFKRSK